MAWPTKAIGAQVGNLSNDQKKIAASLNLNREFSEFSPMSLLPCYRNPPKFKSGAEVSITREIDVECT